MENPQQRHINKHGRGSRCLQLLGKKFNRLKVIFDCGLNVHGTSMWLCVCDCGRTKLVRGPALTSGNIKGCGCLRKLPEGESRFRSILLMYKIQATKRGYRFNLNDEEAKTLMARNCFYCGSLPSNVAKAGKANGDFIYSGIDRIDNSVGYEGDNCVPCCGVCNWMKRDLTKDQFIDHVHKISEMFSVVSSVI